jgi:hypothetical protein
MDRKGCQEAALSVHMVVELCDRAGAQTVVQALETYQFPLD